MAKRKKPSEPMFTDAEVDRMTRNMEAVPIAIRIAVSRKRMVAHCLRWRAEIKKGPTITKDGSVFTVEFMTFLLRQSQKHLLKLRIWRATGQFPSDDIMYGEE